MPRTLVALIALALPLLAIPAQAADEPEPTTSSEGPGLTTMERRDLRMQLAGSDGATRARGLAALARPVATRTRDFDRVRVHWNQGEATSQYVDQVGTISDDILETYEQAGYRRPLPDGNRGGNAKLDVYLENLGSQGLYGYCDTDQPPTGTGPFDVPAYCAFDNDYEEFPSHTPLENLQVTVAHELFHAVQFAYDYYEDGWFLEAAAAWVEDEMFDDVDDNLQYLDTSPLSSPHLPLDKTDGLRIYGGWIFLRYLTEKFPDAEGGLPVIVREMFDLADGAKGGPDAYSMQAITRVLAEHGTSLRAEWARFAAANRRPAATYEEGAAYPIARLAGTVNLAPGRTSSGRLTRVLDHVTSATIRFNRASGMSAGKLRLTLDLPPTKRGSGAVATIHRSSGEATTQALTGSLRSNGDAVVRLDFGSDVDHVEITLANAGVRYADCYRARTPWSCQGRPQDDNLRFRVSATAVR